MSLSYINYYYYIISCSQHTKTVRLGVHRKKGKKGQEDQEKVHVFGVLGKSGSRERRIYKYAEKNHAFE